MGRFATYTRNSYTGLDYADQRYYASAYGRFNTPDPFGGSMKLGNPGSWNRYSYTRGDPVNNNDPSGLCLINGQEYADGGPACPNVTSLTISGGIEDDTNYSWDNYTCLFYGGSGLPWCTNQASTGTNSISSSAEAVYNQDCKSQVASAQAMDIAGVQTAVDKLKSYNDFLSLAGAAVAAQNTVEDFVGSAGGALVLGIATTVPEALAVGVTSALGTIAIFKALGFAEDVLVNIATKAFSAIYTAEINSKAATASAQCDTTYPTGGTH